MKENELPIELNDFDAVATAYPVELSQCEEALLSGLPVIVECDKELTPFFYKCLRDRLKTTGLTCTYIDGRKYSSAENAMPSTLMNSMINELRDAVRGSVERCLFVLPHLDLLTTSSGGLSVEAKEVIALMYENPMILWLAFKDHSFSMPKVMQNLFPHREHIVGISRERLPFLVTQRECRKFGKQLDVYQLYKYTSGINCIRLRRLLSTLKGEDYPDDTAAPYAQLRRATLSGQMTVPEIRLHEDIGGYDKVKQRLNNEILQILKTKEGLQDAEQIRNIEDLVPKGMIFWGPPGTGKTLFAKAMATVLGAAVIVVSGPELKSRWVGESEQQLRQIFMQARQSAPAIIVFDELDSFATARGTYTGSGVEHSMVNQLLTEMDGFRKNEMVFVVGTTNFVESLDPALLRPGRFEFHLHIPYPSADDRRAIFNIYDKQFSLKLSQQALDYAVKRTAGPVDGGNSRYSGDHIQALCRGLARYRIRKNRGDESTVKDVEDSLTEYLDRPDFTPMEERVIATHECGHAICALHCSNVPSIDRISIKGDLAGALGFVSYNDPAHKYVITQGALLDTICVLFGGREAEVQLLDDVSIGASQDIEMATNMARDLVEELGLGPEPLAVRSYVSPADSRKRMDDLSSQTKEELDDAVALILDQQRKRAAELISKHKDELIALRDMLLKEKVIDGQSLVQFSKGKKNG